MSIVVSGAVSNVDTPSIGYENRVTSANISSTTEDADFPVTNLANVSTNLLWKGVAVSPAVDEYITVDLPGANDADYVGIARHNFGSAGITMSVEGLVDEAASPEVWIVLVEETAIASDQPLIFKFEAQTLDKIRVRLQPGTAAPQAAVLYVGALLELQRNIYVGHTPITLGRHTVTAQQRSESGNYLGRVIVDERTQTSVNLRNLTPAWYRTFFDPFVTAARDNPFFFAWRPSSYPNEVGFAWLTDDPIPVNEQPNGMMQVEFRMNGILT